MKPQSLKLARLGYFLIAVAVVFFLAMMFMAPQSTDPVEVMRLAGQASGVAGGVGIVLIIVDYLRRLPRTVSREVHLAFLALPLVRLLLSAALSDGCQTIAGWSVLFKLERRTSQRPSD